MTNKMKFIQLNYDPNMDSGISFPEFEAYYNWLWPERYVWEVMICHREMPTYEDYKLSQDARAKLPKD